MITSKRPAFLPALLLTLLLAFAFCAAGCSSDSETQGAGRHSEREALASSASDSPLSRQEQAEVEAREAQAQAEREAAEAAEAAAAERAAQMASAEGARAALDMVEDIRPNLAHGYKGVESQKYIVLHDTEGDADGESVLNWWDSNGNLVAAHFVVNKDGSIVQCGSLDTILHHAGFGDMGHNAAYGTEDESRDDKLGTTPIGSWASDYGMNSYSVGIELVHVGGSGGYPQAQLEALDNLIAYIDAYYGFESQIIDHKAWRSGNSDTSPEFAGYLANYQATRSYAG